MATIEVRNLCKNFGDFVAVRVASFTVEDGQFVCLLGPSGCGKTTTLADDRRARAADLRRDPPRRRGRDAQARLGTRHRLRVPALRALPAHERAAEHRVSAAQYRHARRRDRPRRVAEAARILRIEHLLDRSVSGLSSGDRQRVALGRAIVREPAAFMMDEPLGALDAEFRHLMCGELRALHDRLRATTVYVTHDQLEAMAMADRIAVMNAGVIEQFGPPQEIYDRPATLFVADFIGSPPMNFVGFAGALARGDRAIRIGDASQPVPELREDRAEAEHVLGVRPEHVRLSDEGWLRGEVYGSEYLGTTQIVTVRTARGQVRARLPAGASVQRGETVGLALKPDKLSLFDRATGRADPHRSHTREAWRMARVELARVSKRFKDIEAVAELSLTIADGEFVVLLGPTGAGKTTTLRLVAGLERPDAGTIRIGGVDRTQAEPARRDVAFVFQQYSLYPHLSVYDNLAFPLRSPLRRIPEPEIRARVTEIARLLRIDDKLRNPATRLSGGQMQRVAIGRALVRRPSIYLMDEPLSSLDAKLRADLRLELVRIQQEFGATILYVTHDQIEAMTMADRIGVMEAGTARPGRHAPRDLRGPRRRPMSRRRLGHPAVNLVPRSLVRRPAGAARNGADRRAHRAPAPHEGERARSAPRASSARSSWIEHLGDQNHLHVKVGDAELVTLADPDSGLSVGDRVAVELARPLFFDEAGRRIVA